MFLLPFIFFNFSSFLFILFFDLSYKLWNINLFYFFFDLFDKLWLLSLVIRMLNKHFLSFSLGIESLFRWVFDHTLRTICHHSMPLIWKIPIYKLFHSLRNVLVYNWSRICKFNVNGITFCVLGNRAPSFTPLIEQSSVNIRD